VMAAGATIGNESKVRASLEGLYGKSNRVERLPCGLLLTMGISRSSRH